MLNEYFFGSAHFIGETVKVRKPDLVVPEETHIEMGVGSMTVSHLKRPVSTYRHFDPFDCIKEEKAQLSIGGIRHEDLFEGRSGSELMSGVVYLERQPVGGEPAIVDLFKGKLSLRGIGEGHAARVEQSYLLSVSSSGLCEL